MLDRKTLLALAVGGLFAAAPVSHCVAQSRTEGVGRLLSIGLADDRDSKADKDDDDKDKGEKHDQAEDKDEKHWHGDRGEKKQDKEIEQTVPMEMVPAAVLDVVKKEVPGGTITEAELEAKKGKIMYCFDVKAGETAYEVKVTVDGKFYSKKIDDEKDEKDENDEKADTGGKKK